MVPAVASCCRSGHARDMGGASLPTNIRSNTAVARGIRGRRVPHKTPEDGLLERKWSGVRQRRAFLPMPPPTLGDGDGRPKGSPRVRSARP